MGISDYFAEITKLTKTNLELLSALNNSLSTDANHLSVTVDGATFSIPSFISLENKINSLQANFENLVNSPKTSEAYFTFDGDSRSIQIRSYEQGPEPIALDTLDESFGTNVFYHEDNNIFKDFLDPTPYIKLDISPLSNDITSADIRKVVALSDAMKSEFSSLLQDEASTQVEWGDLYKVLLNYTEGTDYIQYDTVQKLPIRTGQGYGIYIIKEVEDEYVDDNLNQHYIIKIDTAADNSYGYQNSLTYKLFDQTIDVQLKEGDILVNGAGTAKFKIESVDFNTGKLTLQNIHNEYGDLMGWSGSDYADVPSNSTLRFFSNAGGFQDLNYVKVPLEENQYIFVAVAPLNDRMNIRASWGTGILVDVFKLKSADENNTGFEEYYKNCRNIGDILNEISKVMSNTTTLLSDDDISTITSAKLSEEDVLYNVVKINTHLNDNVTIENIKSLYKTKQSLKNNLAEIQAKITNNQNTLLTTNFQDSTGIRTRIENELAALNKQKNDIINSINKNMQAISTAASNATIPIEKSKYRIRGFVDFKNFVSNLANDHVTEENIKGIRVQYQYVNPQNDSIGKATSFTSRDSTRTFLFSDWNELHTVLRPRVRKDDGTYGAYDDKSDANEPSFNQFDIPITQGESVNVKIEIVYDFGYPFIQMTSAWCDTFTVEFPIDLVQDVDVVDMIEENNDDIENNRFEKILNDNGIIQHVNDKITDQDRVYYHNPNNIASGFFTEDSRRIIPLDDKLKEMNDNIARILGEIDNDVTQQLEVSVSYGDSSNIILKPYTVNDLVFKDFKDFQKITPTKTSTETIYDTGGSRHTVNIKSATVGGYNYYRYSTTDTYRNQDQFAETICNITLTNVSDKIVRLFTLFPAEKDMLVSNIANTSAKKDDYTNVYMRLFVKNPDSQKSSFVWSDQKSNQIITFRNKNTYDNTNYYDSTASASVISTDDKLSSYHTINWDSESDYPLCPYADIVNTNPNSTGTIYEGTCVYPQISNDSFFMSPAEAFSYKVINPGEQLIIPVIVRYNLYTSNTEILYTTKIISFDIRTSLYKDPTNYTMRLITGYNMTDKNAWGYTDSVSGEYIPSVSSGTKTSTGSSTGNTSFWIRLLRALSGQS